MKTNLLGNSDLAITSIGFGAWAIGGEWEFGWDAQDDTESVAAIHRALELGVNWIDTPPSTVWAVPKRSSPGPCRNGRERDPTSSPNAG
jgi:predicted aldo/keto reductase-like oxidoreductase